MCHTRRGVRTTVATERLTLYGCLFAVLVLVQPYIHLDAECQHEEDTLICLSELPRVLPENITKVYITHLYEPIYPKQFWDPSWKSLTLLDIHYYTNSTLSDLFSPLINLRYFGLHLHVSSRVIGSDVFRGLDKLETLDLSNSPSLYIINPESNIMQAISRDNVLPNLETLNLNNVGNFNYGLLHARLFFWKMLKDKGIKHLYFANQSILLEFSLHEIWPSPPYDPLPLETVSIDSVALILPAANPGNRLTHLPIPLSDVLRNLINITIVNLPHSTYWVNPHRYSRHRHDYIFCKNNTHDDKIGLRFMFSIPIVVVQNVSLHEREWRGIIDSAECTDVKLKTLWFVKVGLRTFNATVAVPTNWYLDEINFSQNNLEYFSVKGNFQSKTLLLSNNNLQKMVGLPEFETAFDSFTILEHLDLSHNTLTSLPHLIFSENTHLKRLDLRGNKFISVSFKIDHLKSLIILDFRNNEIKYLSSESMAIIQNGINGLNVTVDLHGNPFECSCRTADFIRWLANIPKSIREYKCDMEGNIVTIDRTLYKACEYLCYRNTIYIAVSLCVGFVIIIIIISSFKIRTLYAKRILEIRKRELITNFKGGNVYVVQPNQDVDQQQQRPVDYFVSITNSQSDENKSEEFAERLNKEIKKILNTDKETVSRCEPGQSVLYEWSKRDLISCLNVYIISQEFCDDRRCIVYLGEISEDIPRTVFLIVDNMEERMRPEVKKIWKRVFKVKVSDTETTHWEAVSADIVDTAVNALVKSKLKIIKPEHIIQVRYHRESETQSLLENQIYDYDDI